jgi:hypothetical protein
MVLQRDNQQERRWTDMSDARDGLVLGEHLR